MTPCVCDALDLSIQPTHQPVRRRSGVISLSDNSIIGKFSRQIKLNERNINAIRQCH